MKSQNMHVKTPQSKPEAYEERKVKGKASNDESICC
jgi:hypothetical protein